MYHHVKKLMYSVKVDTPNVRFGNMLLEQFGGANGELAASIGKTGGLTGSFTQSCYTEPVWILVQSTTHR